MLGDGGLTGVNEQMCVTVEGDNDDWTGCLRYRLCPELFESNALTCPWLAIESHEHYLAFTDGLTSGRSSSKL
jgi:hypothetical protein